MKTMLNLLIIVLSTVVPGHLMANLASKTKWSFRWTPDSPLIQKVAVLNEKNEVKYNIVEANPEFRVIVPDLHCLIKRSYDSTKRDGDKGNYIHVHMLEQDDSLTVVANGDFWHCKKNFQGQQGNFSTGSLGSRILNAALYALAGTAPEVDYPGFIAYHFSPNNANDDIIWLAVVLRGSQGEDFQPASGMLGASWLTNYNMWGSEFHENFYPFKGKAHSGYLNKMLTCKISMITSINEALEEIGEDNFYRVRFIVIGHSQGGGLAQIALPMIIDHFGYIYSSDDKFDNSKTPRFFGYFASAPRVICDEKTAKKYINYVGASNMIRHQAYGDVVPMLCDYQPLGELALDTFYDIVCRGIRSEMAYCNRDILFWAIKDLFDPAKFTINKKNDCWISIEKPLFRIYWTELRKIIGSQRTLNDLSMQDMFRSFLTRAFRLAHPLKPFEREKNIPYADDEFLLSLLKAEYDVYYVEKLLDNFVFFRNVKLDEMRKIRVFVLGDEFEKSHGSSEKIGLISSSSTWKSLSDISNTANSFNDFASFIGPTLAKIIPPDCVSVDHRMSTTGEVSALAYAHYGSQSNFFKSKLFDLNVPSKDINLSLRNGSELLRKKNKNERCVFAYEEPLPDTLLDILAEL